MKKLLFLVCLLSGLFPYTYGQLIEIKVDEHLNSNEPTLALSPSLDTFFVATNVNHFFTLSKDENISVGHSWRVNHVNATSPYGVYGDPVLRYAGDTLFFAHLAKAEGKEYGEWFDRIVLQKLTNPTKWEEQSYSVGFNGNKMQDKPWITPTPSGDVLISWTEFDSYGSQDLNDRSRIRFAKYQSGANTVSQAITISDTTGDCMDGDNTLEGATTAAGKNKAVYAVWAGYENIYFDKSTDGGDTWGVDRVIATQPGGWDMDMPNIMRANGMPFILNNETRGELFVVWADERNGNADIWLVVSSDQGESWTTPQKLNLDETQSHQYFPNIVLDKNNGCIYVAYYDFKSSPTNTFYAISVAKRDTTGRITNATLTPFVSALPGTEVFFGDYLDIDLEDTVLGVVYTTYDLAQKTMVSVLREETINDGIFSLIGVNNSLALVKNVDQTLLVLNIEHAYKLRCKIVWKDKVTGKKHKFRLRRRDVESKSSIDEVLASLDFRVEDQLLSIKYKFKDLEVGTKYSRKIMHMSH